MSATNIQANRLANPDNKADHCKPLPAEKCSPSLKTWKKKGCITEAEYNYAINTQPIPVPFCIDMSGEGDGPWEFNSWCYCSCLAKGTKILVEDSVAKESLWVPIEEVVADQTRYSLLVPSGDSTRSSMKYQRAGIKTYTVGPEEIALVVLSMRDGSELILTGNHQVLNADGRLIEASNLLEGANLVSFDGTLIEIEKIGHRIVIDDVYNVLTDGQSDLSHFIFAERLTVGDLLWENTSKERIDSLNFPQE